MAQQKQIRLGTLRFHPWPRSVRQGSGVAVSCELWCRSQTRLGSSTAMAGRRPGAVALIQPPAWEPPYAVGVAVKRQ